MRRYTRRAVLAAVITGGVGGLAGCSSDDGSGQSTPTEQQDTEEDSVTETKTQTPEPTETATASRPSFAPVDWPTYQYTAGNLGETTETTGPTGPVSPRWTYDLGVPTQGSMALVDGTLFVGSGSPDGNAGGIHAVNAATGEREWLIETGAVQATPTVDSGLVFAGSDDGTLYALNSSNGNEFWTYELQSNERVTSPDIADGTVYVGTTGGAVLGIDSTNGSRKWVHRPGAAIDSPVAYGNGELYVGDDSSSVHGVQAGGDPAWSFDANGGINGVTTDARSVMGTTQKGKAFALNTNGRLIWDFGTDGAIRQNPVVSGDWTYFGTVDGDVYGLEGGLEIWHTDLEAELVNSPILVDGTLYFVSRDGTIIAVDSESGDVQWTASIGATVVNSTPIVSDGRLFVTAMDGTLYALDAQA